MGERALSVVFPRLFRVAMNNDALVNDYYNEIVVRLNGP